MENNKALYFTRLAHSLTIAGRCTGDRQVLAAINELLHGVTQQIAAELTGRTFSGIPVTAETSMEWLKESAAAMGVSDSLELAICITDSTREEVLQALSNGN